MNKIKSLFSRKNAARAAVVMLALGAPAAFAATLGTGGGTGGTEFQAFYNFIIAAATGFLGRSIAIVGGVLGLGIGAFTGKGLPALIGVFLAVFGVLGPTIINALFTSAII